MNPLTRIAMTRAPASVVIVRLLVGAVFLSEGIQKFLFPDADGVGRFGRIGIPAPEILAPFVAVTEIVCGAMIVAGLLTRLVSVPLLVVMCVAIVSTKLPVLLGHTVWGFSLPKLSQYGFWSMAHEGRADFSMFMCLAFLIVAGGGRWSADAILVPCETAFDSRKAA